MYTAQECARSRSHSPLVFGLRRGTQSSAFDVWNFYETGFRIGWLGKSKVVVSRANKKKRIAEPWKQEICHVGGAKWLSRATLMETPARDAVLKLSSNASLTRDISAPQDLTDQQKQELEKHPEDSE
ncbi:hypothetical protein V8E54_010632 [Elaphomyces granulatus]